MLWAEAAATCVGTSQPEDYARTRLAVWRAAAAGPAIASLVGMLQGFHILGKAGALRHGGAGEHTRPKGGAWIACGPRARGAAM